MNEDDTPREPKFSTRSTRSSTPSSAVRTTRTRVSRSQLQSTPVDSDNQSHDDLSEKSSTRSCKADEVPATSRQKRSAKGQSAKLSGDPVTSAALESAPSASSSRASNCSGSISADTVIASENGGSSNNVVTDRVLPVEKETEAETESKIAPTDKQQQQQQQQQPEQLSQQNVSNNDLHDQGPCLGPTDVDTDDYESIVPIGEVNSQVGRKSTTGQICSLKTLIEDDVLQPGDNVLSMDCMGNEFTGDLLPNGYIRWIRTKQVFSTPSSWVNHCKKTLNLDSNSSAASASKSAWSTIKYNGKRLDSYKLRWYRKQKRIVSTANSMVENVVDSAAVGLFAGSSIGHNSIGASNNAGGSFTSSSSSSANCSNHHNSSTSYIANTAAAVVAAAAAAAANSNSNHTVTSNIQNLPSSLLDSSNSTGNFSSSAIAAAAALVTAGVPVLSGIDRMIAIYSALSGVHLEQNSALLAQKLREHNIVDHLTLGTRLNPSYELSTIVRCSTFPSLDRIQPFSVTVSTNALLLIDFHCHLTANEVTGYLAGTWDLSCHSLTILQAFPCRSRLNDKERASAVEEEIRHNLEQRNLSLIGWYHSHPNSPPQPSMKDIEAQFEYQVAMKGESDSAYLPCVGLICSPYDPILSSNISLDSVFQMYWIMPPPEYRPYEFGKPMHMMYTITRDSFLTQDLLLEMRLLAHFYMNGVDSIKFSGDYIASNAAGAASEKCAQDPIGPPNGSKEKSNDTHASTSLPAAASTETTALGNIASSSDASAGNRTGKSSTLSDAEDAVLTDATARTNDNDTATLTNESSACEVQMNSTNKKQCKVDSKEREAQEASEEENDSECAEQRKGTVDSLVTGKEEKTNDTQLVNQCEKEKVSSEGENGCKSKRKKADEIDDGTVDSGERGNLSHDTPSEKDGESNRQAKKLKRGDTADTRDVKIADDCVDHCKQEAINLDDESKAMKKSVDEVTDENVNDAHGKEVADDQDKIISDDSDNSSSVTYWAKLQASLTPNLPRDLQSHTGQREASQVQQQAIAHFWAFLRGLLVR